MLRHAAILAQALNVSFLSRAFLSRVAASVVDVEGFVLVGHASHAVGSGGALDAVEVQPDRVPNPLRGLGNVSVRTGKAQGAEQ